MFYIHIWFLNSYFYVLKQSSEKVSKLFFEKSIIQKYEYFISFTLMFWLHQRERHWKKNYNFFWIKKLVKSIIYKIWLLFSELNKWQ